MFDIKLGINSPYDLFRDNYSQYNYTGLSGGWKLRDNGGIGYYMLTDGTTSFNPGASVDIVGSYTWIWDNS